MNKRLTKFFLNVATYIIVFILGASFFFYKNKPTKPKITPTETLIESLPYIITKGGTYLLGRNLIYSSPKGTAIEIASDNVTLDLNGFAIETKVPASAGEATGILAEGRNNIILHNGRVSGFFFGVYIKDNRTKIGFMEGSGRKISNLQVTRSKYEGIHIEGRQSIVENCQVRDTGGYRRNDDQPIYIHGIALSGENSVIQNNEVLDTFNWGLPFSDEAVGITVSESFATRIESNTIANRERGCFDAYGIWITGDSYNIPHTPVFILNNRLVNLLYGIGYGHISDGFLSNNVLYDVDYGFYANTAQKFSKGILKQDTSVGVGYVNSGGSTVWADAGNNLEITSKLNSYRKKKHCTQESIYAPLLKAEGFK